MHTQSAARWALAFALLATLAVPGHGADNSAVVGKWTLSMEFQGQPVEFTLEITESDGALAGTWTGPRGSDAITDVNWDGETLTFARTVSRQGQEFQVQHSAKVSGDSLEGKMILPQREVPFTGQRAS